MKLQTLKKIFKKKYVIRVVAGALVVGLIATGSVQYTAMADKASETEQTTNSIINGEHVKVSSKDLDKDETVYLISKPDGTVSDTIVAAHLINKDGEDTIDDVASDLTDITNTNGDEKFTQNGDDLTWQADGNDIYYQGHTTKEAPVTVKVTYTLDGNEVTPDELAGKSGHVKIHYDYTNNTNFEEKVNGEDVSTVVPFAAITGMILNDDFSNVKVDNGRIVQNGTKTIVIGYALPGIKDSLERAGGSFDKDLSLPESLDIEADVKDFDLQTQMTAIVDASNMLTSNSEDTEDLGDDMDKLQDAGAQLKDGSKQLQDGAGTLSDGAKKLENGAKSAQSGSQKLQSGSKQLRDGLGTLNGSLGTFSSGLKTYTAGVAQLNGGIGQLKTSLAPLSSGLPALKNLNVDSLAKQLSALSTGVAQLKNGSDQLLAGYNGDGTETNPGLVKSMDQLTTGSKSVSDAASKVSDGASALDKGIGQIQSALSGVGSQFSTQSQTQLTQTIDSKLNSQTALIGLLRQTGILGADEKITLSNIDTVVTKLEAAQNAVIAGVAQANGVDTAKATATYYTALDGLHQVQAAKTALDTAGKSLQSELTSQTVSSQIKQLTDGSKQLADGSSKLAEGAKTVSDGMTQANDGVKKLAAGQKQLSDGINQFSSGLGSADLSGLDISSISDLSGQFSKLISGVDQLYTGSSTLVANSSQLTGGADQISGGVSKLYSGAKTLYTGQGTLTNGLGTLSSGTSELSSGATKLSDGAGDLYDGIVKFNKEGIEELVNAYNGDIKPLADHLRAAIDAGEQYESFSGLADGKNGAVKFLYRMDGITAPDEN
ncbi:MAG: hypothetical protein PUF16_04740 [Lachnospiraceae bacterium]|nr:hypothetical protein [Lachnospiraceae bacterium]